MLDDACCLLQKMDFKITYYENSKVPTPDLRVARWKPTMQTPDMETLRIAMIAHADTVCEGQDVNFSRDKLWLNGSGAIDNKGGMVVLIESIRKFLESSISSTMVPNIELTVILSPNEESGSIGFHEIYGEIAKDTDVVLGFEPCLENGSILHSRRGNRWYRLQSFGREEHSGRAGKNSENAAHSLIEALNQIINLANPQDDLNIHVGGLTAGRGLFNIICAKGEALIDVRFSALSVINSVHTDIHRILREVSAGRLRNEFKTENEILMVQIDDDCPPAQATPLSKFWSQYLTKQISKIEDRPVRSVKGQGASDANYFSTENNFVIDGLGPLGIGMHTSDERIWLPSIESRSTAVANLLHEFSARGVGMKHY